MKTKTVLATVLLSATFTTPAFAQPRSVCLAFPNALAAAQALSDDAQIPPNAKCTPLADNAWLLTALTSCEAGNQDACRGVWVGGAADLICRTTRDWHPLNTCVDYQPAQEASGQ